MDVDDDLVVISNEEERRPADAGETQAQLPAGVAVAWMLEDHDSDSLPTTDNGELMVSGENRTRDLAIDNYGAGARRDLSDAQREPDYLLYDDRMPQELITRAPGQPLAQFEVSLGTVRSDVGDETVQTASEYRDTRVRAFHENDRWPGERHTGQPFQTDEQAEVEDSVVKYGWVPDDDDDSYGGGATEDVEDADEQTFEFPGGIHSTSDAQAVYGRDEMANREAVAAMDFDEPAPVHPEHEWLAAMPASEDWSREELEEMGRDALLIAGWFKDDGVERVRPDDVSRHPRLGTVLDRAPADGRPYAMTPDETYDPGEAVLRWTTDERRREIVSQAKRIKTTVDPDVAIDLPSVPALVNEVAAALPGVGGSVIDATTQVAMRYRDEDDNTIIGGHPDWMTSGRYSVRLTVEGTVTAVMDDPSHPRQGQVFYIEDDEGRQAKATVWCGHHFANPKSWEFVSPHTSSERCAFVTKGDRVLLEDFTVREYNGKTILASSRKDKQASELHILADSDSEWCPTGYGPSEDIETNDDQSTTITGDDLDVEKEVPGMRSAVRSKAFVREFLPTWRDNAEQWYGDLAEKRAMHAAISWTYPNVSWMPDWFVEKHADSPDDDVVETN
jgi:hypothetical protein